MSDRTSAVTARALRPACLAAGGVVVTAAALAMDLRWIDQPVAVLLLIGDGVRAPGHAGPPEQVLLPHPDRDPGAGGRGGVGPTPVVLGLWLGVFGSDVLWLRKLPRAGFINAGREVLGFVGGLRALRRGASTSAGSPRSRSTSCPPARDPGLPVLLRHPRALLLHAAGPGQAGVRREDPHPPLGDHLLPADPDRDGRRGRRAAGSRAGRLGGRRRSRSACSALLTRKILEEAIGAEDLNKVHLMETAIASNATLQGSFDQIERLAYRLLDWGDFRVYRCGRHRAHAGLPRSSRPARTAASLPTEMLRPFRARGASLRARRSMVRDVRRDPRIGARDGRRGEHRGPPDPVRRRAARHGRGGPSQAARLRPQGPRRAQHAGQSDGHRDSHRRAAPAAAQHGRSRSASRSPRWRG